MPRICPACGQKYDDKVEVCPKDQCPTVFVSPQEALIGKVLDGRFTLRALLGVGGMGAVYRAHQHSMDRDVAVKVLRSDLARSEQEVLRFFREARAASKLSHPNIITVFDFGQSEDGLLYMVMELLQGKPLSKLLLETGPLPLERAINIILQTLDALAHAHSVGILHRDLKPDNIFLVQGEGKNEIVKVLDFGIAKVMGTESQTLTSEGMVVGTPAYMSPEQAMGQELDQRSDLYSLGTIFFEMLTGRKPFEGDSPISILYRKVNEEPPRIRDVAPKADVPPEVEKLIRDLLKPRPEMRPKSASEVKERLEQIKGGSIRAQVEPPMPSIAREQRRITHVMPALLEAPSTAEKGIVKSIPVISFFAASICAFFFVVFNGVYWSSGLARSETSHIKLPPVIPDTPLLPDELQQSVRLTIQAVTTTSSAESMLEHLAKTCDIQTRYGIRNIFALASVLQERVDEIKGTLLPRDAALIANYLDCVCPDCPEIQRTVASLHIIRGVKGLPSAFEAYWRSFSPFSNPKNFARAISSWGFFLLLTSLCLFLVFTTFMFLRHYPEVEHAFRHALSFEVSGSMRYDLLARLSIFAFIGAVVFVPFSAGFGLFLSSLVACLLLVPFASVGETILLGFLALLAAGAPIYSRLAGAPLSAVDTVGEKAWHCMYGTCRPSYLRDLKDYITHNLDKNVLAAFSAPVLRVGMDKRELLDEAENALSSLLERPNLLLAHIGLMKGVSDTVGGEVNAGYLLSAEEMYLAIIKQEHPPDEAFVGLAFTQMALKKRGPLKSTIETMTRRGLTNQVAKIQALQLEMEKDESTFGTMKKAIAEMLSPPKVPAIQFYLTGLDIWRFPIIFPGKRVFLGRVPVDFTQFLFAAVFLILVPLVKVVSTRYPIPTRCTNCNHISCKACNLAFSGIDLCPTCLLSRVAPPFVPKEAARRYKQVSKVRLRSLLLLVPGAPQALGGSPAEGAFCSFLFLGGIIVIFVIRNILPDEAPASTFWTMVKGAFLVVVAYGWTLRDYFGEKE